jgi:uncharacterized membrane-anchored protein YitT (DUF2179 family)
MLPGDGDFLTPLFTQSTQPQKTRPLWFRRKHHHKQYVVFITTQQPQPLIQRLHCELGREVVTLFGDTSPEARPTRPTLMCPSTSNEITHLKSLISAVDPQAMIIILPAEDVLNLEPAQPK